MWFVDTEGQLKSFRSSPAAKGCKDILVIDVKKMFKLNRWKAPAGTDPKEHITRLTVCDRENRYLRDCTMHQLRDAAFKLLRLRGVFNERDLLEDIRSQKYKPGSREYMSQQSLVNRQQDSVGSMESVYCTNRSHNLAALIHRSVVWELEGLSSDLIAMFVNDLLLFLREIMPVLYEQGLVLAIIIDELTHITNISRLTRADIQEPLLLDSFRIFRKRGCSIISGTQEPFSIPRVILANVNGLWAVFRPAEAYSAKILSYSLALNRQQSEYMLQMPERQLICRTRNYPKAFLGQVPQIHLPVATEEELAARLEYSQKVLSTLLEPEPEEISLFVEKKPLRNYLKTPNFADKPFVDLN